MTNEQLDALEALAKAAAAELASTNSQRTSLLEFTLELRNGAPELIAAARENQRLRDLVRHQRAELHEAGLIDDEEYAAIASDHAAVKRLETYDELKAAARTLEKLRPLVGEMLESWPNNHKPIYEIRKLLEAKP